MPDPQDFWNEYVKIELEQLDGIELVSYTIKHVVKKRYEFYEFPILMIVRSSQPKSELQALLNQLTFTGATVYSRYGNPYQCSLQDLSVSKLNTLCRSDCLFEVSVKGTAVRV